MAAPHPNKRRQTRNPPITHVYRMGGAPATAAEMDTEVGIFPHMVMNMAGTDEYPEILVPLTDSHFFTITSGPDPQAYFTDKGDCGRAPVEMAEHAALKGVNLRYKKSRYVNGVDLHTIFTDVSPPICFTSCRADNPAVPLMVNEVGDAKFTLKTRMGTTLVSKRASEVDPGSCDAGMVLFWRVYHPLKSQVSAGVTESFVCNHEIVADMLDPVSGRKLARLLINEARRRQPQPYWTLLDVREKCIAEAAQVFERHTPMPPTSAGERKRFHRSRNSARVLPMVREESDTSTST